MKSFSRLAAIIAALACLTVTTVARAQQEFPPPQGKGRVVVVASGMSGPEHYTTVSREIAEFGYDVVLFDGNTMEGTHGAALKSAILQAQQMPHALPGKVALVSFSLGGGISLYYGSQWPDLVSGVIVWYPATAMISSPSDFASKIRVPILMFAGEKDHYRNDCCTADKARILADAAKAAGDSFELVTYPNTEHDFVKGGSNYNPKSYADALQRTENRLRTYLGN